MKSLGVGLGYRGALRQDILENCFEIDFLEILADQFMFVPDRREILSPLLERFPVVAHSVGLSLGGSELPNAKYLDSLAELVDAIDAKWFSDHVALTQFEGCEFEQLASLWRTEEGLEALTRNIKFVQRSISRPFLIENISHYYRIGGNQMSEAEFIRRAAIETDSGILLDVNNVYVNSVNLGEDPYAFISGIPPERVMQIHIAGGSWKGDMIIDTHSSPVCEAVWKLLEYTSRRCPFASILLEWDADFPEFGVLREQLTTARSIQASALR